MEAPGQLPSLPSPKSGAGLTTLRMPVIPTIRLLFVIWTNAPFLLHIIEA